MSLAFRIPKKTPNSGSDSAHIHVQSPLSRLQSPAPQAKGYRDSPRRGNADRLHAGNARGSTTDRLSAPHRPPFKDVVKTLLGINSTNGGRASAANQRPASQRTETSTNGWRPKRASDRLLKPSESSERQSPSQKSPEHSGVKSLTKVISVESVDSLATLRTDGDAGSLTSSVSWKRRSVPGEMMREAGKPQKKNSSSSETSEDEFVCLPRTRPGATATSAPPLDVCQPSAAASSSSSSTTVTMAKALPSSRMTPDRRRSLKQRVSVNEDVMEVQRDRWRKFREERSRSAAIHLPAKKTRQTPTEPIVLSSEEEEGEEEEEEEHTEEAKRTSQSGSQVDQRGNSEKKQASKQLPPPPSFLQLPFVTLHAGLLEADANGPMMITENSISLPVKGEEEGDVTVVASQVLGYGVWDGGVARSGTLLSGWEGPAPSLLFLWVSKAQANMLHRELSTILTTTAGPPCSVLLLLLKEQLQELQAAMLASIMDMEYYKQGRCYSSGPTSPVDWADGLLLVHSCPPPVDQHLLRLLGHSAKSSRPTRTLRSKSSLSSAGQQQLPARLVQYPLAPCKGRITISREDLACLDAGEFLNDVIIDFYLKYLLLEGGGGPVAQRSHVFSSFFYKQLSRRRAAGESDTPSVPDRHTRHQRVKTWTRHVDIFTKDFLFVPVNQEAHWFLVVVCFPGLEEVQHEDYESRAGGSERTEGKTTFNLKLQKPDCTQQGCQRRTVMKRPCILVMDSLKLSYRENVCRLLRDYLQVEWEVRRKTPRLFTADSVRSCSCRVPQQDNSSDCGLYLLQYAESFLQNPVVHFDFPLHLENWFPRQLVRQKREEIRSLIMRLHESQLSEQNRKTLPSR